jgi:hypothetical protein
MASALHATLLAAVTTAMSSSRPPCLIRFNTCTTTLFAANCAFGPKMASGPERRITLESVSVRYGWIGNRRLYSWGGDNRRSKHAHAERGHGTHPFYVVMGSRI